MNKKILLIAIFGILLLNLVPLTSAFFTKSHIYWAINGMESVDSPVTQLCESRLDKVIDGMVAADVPVLHYFDEKVMSYVSTHTRYSGYQVCLEQAGTDPDLQCFCYGVGLHNVHDHFSHTEDGLTPKYIESYFSSNLVGHMTVERDFELKHMDYFSEEDIIARGKLEYYNDRVLDNLFQETGGDYKYLQLLNDMSGIDMRNDANIFANGYKGQGFYNTVYKQKLSLPWWFWSISIGSIIIGFGAAVLFALFGKTKWKYSLIVIYFIIGVIGGLILVSFYTNNTWQWIQAAVMIAPIRVSQSDVVYYDNIVQQRTNDFLETSILRYDDNSGLSYVDRNGNYVEGALEQAQKRFLYFLLPIIMGLFVLLNIFLIYKTFKSNK